MEVQKTSQFGWPNDNGIGEKLIQQILAGQKTATAAPKYLCSEDALAEIYQSVGAVLSVIDKGQNPRCRIRVLDVFETTFGTPDPRLVRGEGYGDDAEAFRVSHRSAWKDLIASGQLELNEDTVLLVEVFELIPE